MPSVTPMNADGPGGLEELLRPQVSSATSQSRYADAVELFSHATRPVLSIEGYPSFAPHLPITSETAYSESEIAVMDEHQKHSFYWLARNRTIEWLAKHYFPNARRVLDIGCGTGYVTRALRRSLPQANIYATESSLQGVKLAARNLANEAVVVHLDAADMPFANSFDLITTFDVLEHIEDDQSVLDRTYAALRPNGGVIHFVPQHPMLFSPADVASRHFRRYGRTELQTKLRRAGFNVVFTSSFVFWLFPLFAASRLKSRLLGKYSLEDEHNPKSTIAFALNAVQGLELAGLRRGLSYPCGVSRAVVAVRN
jgi:SAM-dependent methyltransferase